MVAAPYSVTVTTTAQRIVDYAKDRTEITLYNLGIEAIYIGYDSSVTTKNGYPLLSGDSVSLSRELGHDPRLAIYAICASGTQDVRVMESYLKKEGV